MTSSRAPTSRAAPCGSRCACTRYRHGAPPPAAAGGRGGALLGRARGGRDRELALRRRGRPRAHRGRLRAPRAAARPDARARRRGPILHPGAGSNLAGEIRISWGDVEAAFAEADLVLSERLSCQRHGAVPLEPRGLLAEIEPGSGRLTVWGVAKVVHTNRRILARLLGLAEERVRFVELDVGGGFGGRGEFYPEDFLIPYCALRWPAAGRVDRGPRGEPARAQPLARAGPRRRARPAVRRHAARAARPLRHEHRRLRTDAPAPSSRR